MLPTTLGLPDFPWDTLTPARVRAAEHPQGACDLSIGTPVDPTPELIQDALALASDAPGYPTVVGTQAVRDAIREWGRQRGMVDPGDAGVIPTIGSKEAVAWTPLMLGVKPGDTVLVPDIAYPTYDIGARLAGATPVPVDPTAPETWPEAAVVYLNSPGNPHGYVMSPEELRQAVRWAREHDAVIVSDECYAALPWVEPYTTDGVPSVLRSDICDGDPSNLLVLYSLSKQSNLAGYRSALIYGDPTLVKAIVEIRKHTGMMVPSPIQAAMVAALPERTHAQAQRAVYFKRRELLLKAMQAAQLEVDPRTAAGLYLWVSRPETARQAGGDCWSLVHHFAELGIIVAPGDFYGQAGADYVRVALTASDERIEAAAQRIIDVGPEFFCKNDHNAQ